MKKIFKIVRKACVIPFTNCKQALMLAKYITNKHAFVKWTTKIRFSNSFHSTHSN